MRVITKLRFVFKMTIGKNKNKLPMVPQPQTSQFHKQFYHIFCFDW